MFAPLHTPARLPRLILICVGALLLLIVSTAARADTPVFHSDDGTAISGFDVVAYFDQGEPVAGDPAHAVMWKGAVWLFSSAQNQETFERNPRAFAPQFGGYCAYAMSQGYLAGTDPAAWRIDDGKLYLIHDVNILEMWAQDISGHVIRANAQWPQILFEQ